MTSESKETVNYAMSITASLNLLASSAAENGDHKQEEEMDSEESSDSELEEEKEDEETSSDPVPRQIIAKAQAAVDANIYDYNAHVALIELCRTLDLWEKLRSAREIMSQTFPLTEKLWLDWVEDEQKLKEMSFQEVCDLYTRGTRDYLCPKLWRSYCHFVHSNIGPLTVEDNLKVVRNTFEKALTAVGLDPVVAPEIFEHYVKFEERLCESSDEISEDDRNRITKLYRRQLSVPFVDMEAVYKRFVDLFGEDTEFEKAYQRAQKIMAKLMPHQIKVQQCLSSGESSLEAYQEYLEAEISLGDPSRACCIFERAIQDNALVPELWSKYIQFVSMKIKDFALAESVCKRAIRNVPWVTLVWQHYVNVCEHLKKSEPEVRKIFSEALLSLYGEDTSELYLAYLTYLRRIISNADTTSPNKEIVKIFRDTYHKAFETLQIFPHSLFKLKKFVAFVEAKFFQNLTVFRKIFDNLIIDDSLDTERWLEYISLEEKFGTSTHLQKLYIRAFMYPRMSKPESLVEKYLLQERLNGTLTSLETAIYKTEIFLNQVQKTKESDRLKEEKRVEKLGELDEARAQTSSGKRRHNQTLSNDSHTSDKSRLDNDVPTFKKPKLEGPKQNPFKRNKITSAGKAHPEATVDDQQVASDGRKPSPTKDSSEHSETVPIISSEENADVSIFLSNLDFSVTEDDVKAFFEACGEVAAVSLAKNMAGKSKGFGNLIFKSKESVDEAIKLNREFLCGRPVFVSHFKPSKKQSTASKSLDPESKLVFTTGLERHKLFVSELSTETTKETLTDVFSKYGALKDVRIVTYKNGNSKGLAFVEFEKEDDAKKALMELDETSVDGKQIKIAISNPPARKGQSKVVQSGKSSVVNDKPSSTDYRGKGRSQIQLVPRNVAHQKNQLSSASKRSSSESKEYVEDSSEKGREVPASESGMSNKDFVALIRKN